MRLLLHAWSLRRPLLGGKLKASDLPGLAVELGLQGVEWLDRLLPSYDPQDWSELERLSREAGLGPGALSLSLPLEVGPVRLAEQVDRAKRLLGQAPRLGVRTVRVGLGGGPRRWPGQVMRGLEGLRTRSAREARPLGGLTRLAWRVHGLAGGGIPPVAKLPPRASELDLQSAAWLLLPLARQAQALDLDLCLENHWGLTSHPEDLSTLVGLVWRAGLESREGQGAALGVCLDLGNWPVQVDPAAAAQLLASKVTHVHVKLLSPQARAEAQPRAFAAQLEALRQAGYQGAFSLEYEGSGPAESGLSAGVELMRQLWGESPSQAEVG